MKKVLFFCLAASIIFFFFGCPNNSGSSGTENIKSETTYTFFYSHANSTSLYTLVGKPGDIVPNIPIPKRNFFKFSSWKTESGVTLPETFGSDDLVFYAQWNSSTQIGSKIKPTLVGDVVFTDGSATPFTEIIETPLTEDQKKNLAAVIVTTTYNPENGDNKNGKTMLGLAVHPKHTKWCEQKIKVGSSDVLLSLYAGYDIQSVFSSSQPAQTLSMNPYDGSKNLPPTEQILAYAYWYAPAFYYAYTYGTKTVEMVESLQSGWYLPSLYEVKAFMEDETVRNTFVAIFNLLGDNGINFDMNGGKLSGKEQSTLMLTSYTDCSDPDDVEPNDYGGSYNKEKMWVRIRLYDITAEQKLRDKTPYVNPKKDYEHAAIYWRCVAYDLAGNRNFVKKHAKGFNSDGDKDDSDDAIKKCYAFPMRVFK